MSRQPVCSEDTRRGRNGYDGGQSNGANRVREGQGAMPDSQSACRNASGSQSIVGIGGVGRTIIHSVDSTVSLTVGSIRTKNRRHRNASESASSNFAGSQSVVGIGGIGETDIQFTDSSTTITIESIDNLPHREDVLMMQLGKDET